ncbi:ABC transporter ATP-binding protein [Sporosalibacterium faouarense]|uniref:ABC transporter ATP-binding protein n=1 Tax=Sporosalibacterium faouarense TaxID=516123 RepID=UPI00141C65B2|nr:ABC transporter ATP-binding protein [Sporosalibacterium faouarense]MTI46585.1 ABC transporter ATP-binding protein [Bacillota bacterium]
MKPIVNIENLHFKYDEAEILKAIDLNVPQGSFLSILGPNGSGKTTLLKNICNLLHPHKGSIMIEDKEVERIKYKNLARVIAVVHQGTDVQFDFAVYDVVMMGRFPYLKRFQTEGKEDERIVKKAMEDTSTWELRDKSISEISGGERQRVLIARALTQQPKVLILDEPISHLDIKYQIEILDLCKTLNKEHNITVITTLHDINMASRYSDYIVLLEKGNIRKMDTPERVLTEENIEEVYGIKVDLIRRNENERPIIIPK